MNFEEDIFVDISLAEEINVKDVGQSTEVKITKIIFVVDAIMFGNLFNNKSNLNLLIFSIFLLILIKSVKLYCKPFDL